ncbi:hypothetical protein [Paenibacillus sp. M2]|uniref:hypothetical protein n=1 Tax=Paenibacillus sp. M2 TaxID=3341793 RepID=UPI003988CC95
MHTETLKRDWNTEVSKEEIVRKLYICYPTKAFEGREEIGFHIFNEISNFFKVPFSAVHVVGSAKTGTSYFKSTEFVEGKSDLDIAIISPELFMSYMELSYIVTKGYSDQSVFKIDPRSRRPVTEQFRDYLSKGIFRPDLMPQCNEKQEWWNFFNKLSNQHHGLFKNINAGIYATQYFFEFKQIEALKKYMEKLGGISL